MKRNAEIFDMFQFLYDVTGFNDHQLHCIITFEDRVDAQVVEKALCMLIKAVPLLSNVYVNRNGGSFWDAGVPFSGSDLLTITDRRDQFDQFTYSKTDESKGPQIKACLLREERDYLSILQNHMVSDAAGFKQCIYLLAELYSGLLENPEYTPERVIDADRSFQKILSGMSISQRLKILFLNGGENNRKLPFRFPMSEDARVSPFIVMHRLTPEQYHAIRKYCTVHGVTVNDVILTALFRSVSGMMNMRGGMIDIPIMVDMRRYLTDKGFNALTNLSSTSIISAEVELSESFAATLSKVREAADKRKTQYLGINTFLKLDVMFKFPKRIAYQILKKGLVNPGICMTNIGVIDSKKLTFKYAKVIDAFMCGSIKYRPHFQMSVSSFQDRMTFGVNLYGSAEDRKNIERFYALMEKELEACR